ncbi:MAG: 4'-phosphopantetheinyl transferase superfamily protein [Lachnospiraceae bacterium]|nr:4'-phosphopantetheinyl transferase superfamily protein [Lachnospiraceae bacterium]
MYLYYLFINDDDWTDREEKLLPFVSEKRRRKILSYRFSKDKKLSLYAALLLPAACSEQYGLLLEKNNILWPEKGKPVLLTHPEVHFSISHSGNCAAVAVSDEETGLDVEQLSRSPVKHSERFFSSRENEAIQKSAHPDLEFFRIWTRKEAYGKYLGTGLSDHVLKTNMLDPKHDRQITERILTPAGSVSREELTDLSLPLTDGSIPASALYCSIYGRGQQLKETLISPSELTEFFSQLF